MRIIRSGATLPVVILALLAASGSWKTAIAKGLYQASLDAVHADLLHLHHNISALQSISKTNRHTEVEALCSRAKESVEETRWAWKKIAKAYGERPWMASESIHKVSLEEHWHSCGQTLNTIYSHPHVLPDSSPDYSQPVEACKETYQICHSSLERIWSWEAPGPVPSGRYDQKRQEKRQDHERQRNQLVVSGPGETGEGLRPPYCSAGETACRISSHSTGYECIDVQSELTSCGGCVGEQGSSQPPGADGGGGGENCMLIEGAAGVGCQHGKCVVFSVLPGYSLRHGRPLLRKRIPSPDSS